MSKKTTTVKFGSALKFAENINYFKFLHLYRHILFRGITSYSVILRKVFSGGHFESSNMAAKGHISVVCRQILKCLGHVSL